MKNLINKEFIEERRSNRVPKLREPSKIKQYCKKFSISEKELLALIEQKFGGNQDESK